MEIEGRPVHLGEAVSLAKQRKERRASDAFAQREARRKKEKELLEKEARIAAMDKDVPTFNWRKSDDAPIEHWGQYALPTTAALNEYLRSTHNLTVVEGSREAAAAAAEDLTEDQQGFEFEEHQVDDDMPFSNDDDDDV